MLVGVGGCWWVLVGVSMCWCQWVSVGVGSVGSVDVRKSS